MKEVIERMIKIATDQTAGWQQKLENCLEAELQKQKETYDEEIAIAYKRGYLDGSIKGIEVASK